MPQRLADFKSSVDDLRLRSWGLMNLSRQCGDGPAGDLMLLSPDLRTP